MSEESTNRIFCNCIIMEQILSATKDYIVQTIVRTRRFNEYLTTANTAEIVEDYHVKFGITI